MTIEEHGGVPPQHQPPSPQHPMHPHAPSTAQQSGTQIPPYSASQPLGANQPQYSNYPASFRYGEQVEPKAQSSGSLWESLTKHGAGALLLRILTGGGSLAVGSTQVAASPAQTGAEGAANSAKATAGVVDTLLTTSGGNLALVLFGLFIAYEIGLKVWTKSREDRKEELGLRRAQLDIAHQTLVQQGHLLGGQARLIENQDRMIGVQTQMIAAQTESTEAIFRLSGHVRENSAAQREGSAVVAHVVNSKEGEAKTAAQSGVHRPPSLTRPVHAPGAGAEVLTTARIPVRRP